MTVWRLQGGRGREGNLGKSSDVEIWLVHRLDKGATIKRSADGSSSRSGCMSGPSAPSRLDLSEKRRQAGALGNAKRRANKSQSASSLSTPKDDEDLTLSEKRRRAALKSVEVRKAKKAEGLELQGKESLAHLDQARQVVRERDFPRTGALVDPVAIKQILEEAFGKHSGTISTKVLRAMLIGADCFLRAQAKGLEEHAKVPEPDEIDVDDDGKGEEDDYFLGLKWSWDETTTRLYVNNAEQLAKLMADVGIPREFLHLALKKRACMAYSVIQQRGMVRLNDEVAPIYVPARVIERTTSSNLFAAVDTAIPEVSVAKLSEVAKTGRMVYMGLMGDGVSSNGLTMAGMAYKNPEALVGDDKCLWHQMHLAHLGCCKMQNIAGRPFQFSNSYSKRFNLNTRNCR